MLAAFGRYLMSLFASKIVKEAFARAGALVAKWFASGAYNKDEKKQSEKLDESKEKLKEDLKKAGDDVQSQENAADDFFDSRR